MKPPLNLQELVQTTILEIPERVGEFQEDISVRWYATSFPQRGGISPAKGSQMYQTQILVPDTRVPPKQRGQEQIDPAQE